MIAFFKVMNPQHIYDPKAHLVAGGVAGGLAAAITTPLDCVKTVLNTQQTPLCDEKGILARSSYYYGGMSLRSEFIQILLIQYFQVSPMRSPQFTTTADWLALCEESKHECCIKCLQLP